MKNDVALLLVLRIPDSYDAKTTEKHSPPDTFCLIFFTTRPSLKNLNVVFFY